MTTIFTSRLARAAVQATTPLFRPIILTIPIQYSADSHSTLAASMKAIDSLIAVLNPKDSSTIGTLLSTDAGILTI